MSYMESVAMRITVLISGRRRKSFRAPFVERHETRRRDPGGHTTDADRSARCAGEEVNVARLTPGAALQIGKQCQGQDPTHSATVDGEHSPANGRAHSAMLLAFVHRGYDEG